MFLFPKFVFGDLSYAISLDRQNDGRNDIQTDRQTDRQTHKRTYTKIHLFYR